jgi:hypothetical protein
LPIALCEQIAFPPEDLAGVLDQRSANFRALHLAPDRVFAARRLVKDSSISSIQAAFEPTGIVTQAFLVNAVEKSFAFSPICDFG